MPVFIIIIIIAFSNNYPQLYWIIEHVFNYPQLYNHSVSNYPEAFVGKNITIDYKSPPLLYIGIQDQVAYWQSTILRIKRSQVQSPAEEFFKKCITWYNCRKVEDVMSRKLQKIAVNWKGCIEKIAVNWNILCSENWLGSSQ